MAGEIRIPVGLNTDTAIKDAERLGKDIKRTLANIDTSKADSKTLTFVKNLTNAYQRMQKLTAEAQKLADTPIYSERYKALMHEFEELSDRIAEVRKEQTALLNKGQKHSLEYKQLADEMSRLEKSAENVQANMVKMQIAEEDIISGKSTEAYKNKTDALNIQNQATNILLTRWQELHGVSETTVSNARNETEAINVETEALKKESQAVDELDKAEQRRENRRKPEVVAGSLQGVTGIRFSKRGPQLKAGPSIQSVKFLDNGRVIRDTARANEELARAEDIKVNAIRNSNYVMSQTPAAMSQARKQMSPLASMLNKVGKAFKSLGHHSKESNKQHINFGKTLKKSLNLILRYGLGIRGLFMLFRKLRGYVQEAFKVMAQEIPEVNDAISRLGTAFKQLKASFGTAFQPLLQVIEPILTRIIQRLTELMNQIARLFASLTGQNYIYEATVANYDYAKSVEAAEKANNGALASFDKLNVISKDTTKNTLALDKDTVKYKKVDIDPINLKTTKLYKSLEGVFHLMEVLKDTFVSIWEGGAGEEVLEHLKGTFEGIIRTVNNLADSLAIAWEKNDVGKSITENLFGIFNSIWETIESCVDATSRWAANLDLYPLLESINGILGEISGIFKPILDMVEDLYIHYLLPMGKWFAEKLAPTLGNLIEKYLKVIKRLIDWLKPKLQWIMDKIIRPLGEAVGQAFLDICYKIGDILDIIGDSCDDLFKLLDDWLWPVIQAIAEFLEVVLYNAIKLISGVIQDLLTFIGTMITNIKDALGGLIDFITGVFTLDWEKAWNGLQNIFRAFGNYLISIAETFCNLIIDGLNFFSITLPDWVPGVGGETFGFNFDHVKLDRIPMLAEGAVLPPNQPFLAMVGDQKQGTNIEAPLDTIKQAVAEVLSSINIKNTFDVKGDPNGIFKVVQQKSEVFYNQYGYSPFGGQA